MRDKKAIYMTDCVNQHAQVARSTTNPHLKCKEFIYFITLLTTLGSRDTLGDRIP